MRSKSSRDKCGCGPWPRGKGPYSPLPVPGWLWGRDMKQSLYWVLEPLGGWWCPLAVPLQQALSTCWEAYGSRPAKAPERASESHTSLCQTHGLPAQVSFENDFKGLASSRPQLTLLFEKGENDPSAPIGTWQKNLKNRQLQEWRFIGLMEAGPRAPLLPEGLWVCLRMVTI